VPCWPLSESKVSGLPFCKLGKLILKMQHSTTRQAKQKISANRDHHWSKKCLFLCVQTNWLYPSGTQRFCKNDSDSSLESLTVTRLILRKTWLQSSQVTVFLNLTRVESESPKIVTWVESMTRVTLSLVKKAKNRKSSDEEGGGKQKKQISHNQLWKTRHVSVCECLIVVFKMLCSSLYL